MVPQEVGPYAALLCFQEVLRPPESNIYIEMHLQQSRLDQVAIARLGQEQPQEDIPTLPNDEWQALPFPSLLYSPFDRSLALGA